MKSISKLISTFFGIGYFPIAPGTLASLIIVVLYRFILYKISWFFYLPILLILFFIGVYTSSKYSSLQDKTDPRNIVIDEVLGQLLCLFMLGPSWLPIILVFLLFRFFDIIKPYPIKSFEGFSKGWGIMIDDIIAAVFAGIIINIFLILI